MLLQVEGAHAPLAPATRPGHGMARAGSPRQRSRARRCPHGSTPPTGCRPTATNMPVAPASTASPQRA
eukprot:5480649-Prymnesium_polylepis.2